MKKNKAKLQEQGDQLKPVAAQEAWIDNYLKRVRRLADLVHEAVLLAENLKPDFYHYGKEPTFAARTNARQFLRDAKRMLEIIEHDWAGIKNGLEPRTELVFSDSLVLPDDPGKRPDMVIKLV